MANDDTQVYTIPSAPDRRRAGGSSASADGAGSPPIESAPGYDLDVEAYPGGGVEDVLGRMAELAREGQASARVRALALYTTERLASDARTGHPDRTDRRAVAEALYQLVTTAVEYVPDPHAVELLQSPRATLYAGAGDCDDMSTLSAALLGAVGIPVRFGAIGPDPSRPDTFSHVYCEFQARSGEWITFDAVGNPGVGAPIAEGRVAARMERPVHADGGPGSLAVLAGQPAEARRAAPLKGFASDPIGPVQGPAAWLQITARSHEGSVPASERFWLDVFVKRSYVFIGSCNVIVAAVNPSSNEVIARTRVSMPLLAECEAEARLNFPASFDPAAQRVRLEVHQQDASVYARDGLLGESEALLLTDETVTEVTGETEELARRFELLAQGLITAGTVIGIGFVASSLWPYAERVLPDFTEEDE